MEQQLDYQNEYLTTDDSVYLAEMSARISQLRLLHEKMRFKPDSWQWLKQLKRQG